MYYIMYEILAFWNRDMVIDDPEVCKSINMFEHICTLGTTVKDLLKYDGEFPNLKERDGYTDKNRHIGIAIGCYDKEIDKLKYPLKLVSCSFKGSYEDCVGKELRRPRAGVLSN